MPGQRSCAAVFLGPLLCLLSFVDAHDAKVAAESFHEGNARMMRSVRRHSLETGNGAEGNTNDESTVNGAIEALQSMEVRVKADGGSASSQKPSKLFRREGDTFSFSASKTNNEVRATSSKERLQEDEEDPDVLLQHSWQEENRALELLDAQGKVNEGGKDEVVGAIDGPVALVEVSSSEDLDFGSSIADGGEKDGAHVYIHSTSQKGSASAHPAKKRMPVRSNGWWNLFGDPRGSVLIDSAILCTVLIAAVTTAIRGWILRSLIKKEGKETGGVQGAEHRRASLVTPPSAATRPEHERGEARQWLFSLEVRGMRSVACVRAVERSLLRVQGVRAAKASLLERCAVVECQFADSVDIGNFDFAAALTAAVEAAGFGATLVGRPETCTASQARRPEAASLYLRIAKASIGSTEQRTSEWAGLPGVLEVKTEEAPKSTGISVQVIYLPHEVGARSLLKCIKDDVGEVTLEPFAEELGDLYCEKSVDAPLQADLCCATALAAATVALCLLPPGLPAFGCNAVPRDTALVLVLAPSVLFVCGARFLRTAVVSPLQAPSMDLPIAIWAALSYAHALAIAVAAEMGGTVVPDDMVHRMKHTLGACVCSVAAVLAARVVSERTQQQSAREAWHEPQPTPSRRIACLVEPDGTEKEIDAALIEPLDTLRVNTGAVIPADGVIIHGAEGADEGGGTGATEGARELLIDESLLTGSAMPVTKSGGSPVLAGTVCIGGEFLMRPTHIGVLPVQLRLNELAMASQRVGRPAREDPGLSVLRRFVPVMLVITAVTFVVREWLTTPTELSEMPWWLTASEFVTAMLMVACPCSFCIAFPCGVAAATAATKRWGLHVLSDRCLETLTAATAVVFDKTGTLTLGRPMVRAVALCPEGIRLEAKTPKIQKTSKEVETLESKLVAAIRRQPRQPQGVPKEAAQPAATDPEKVDESECDGPAPEELCAARGVELVWAGTPPSDQVTLFSAFCAAVTRAQLSPSHPLARALHALSQPTTRPDDSDLGAPVRVGHLRPGSEPECLAAWAQAQRGLGRVLLCVSAADGRSLGVVAVEDSPDPDAAALVAELRARGVRMWLATGDEAATSSAEPLAEALGIPSDHVVAAALPGAKVELLQRLRASGTDGAVALVAGSAGAAAALGAADVGVLLCRGTPAQGVASCADLLAAGPRPLEQFKTALELGRKADTVVAHALTWAALLNGLALPLVAGCLWAPGHVRLTPRLAGGLTCASILGAAAASFSLRSWKPAQKVP